MENPPKQEAVGRSPEGAQDNRATNQSKVPETGESLMRKSAELLTKMESLKLENQDSGVEAAVLDASPVKDDGLLPTNGKAIHQGEDLEDEGKESLPRTEANDEETLLTNEEKPSQPTAGEGQPEAEQKKKKKSKSKKTKVRRRKASTNCSLLTMTRS